MPLWPECLPPGGLRGSPGRGIPGGTCSLASLYPPEGGGLLNEANLGGSFGETWQKWVKTIHILKTLPETAHP